MTTPEPVQERLRTTVTRYRRVFETAKDGTCRDQCVNH